MHLMDDLVVVSAKEWRKWHPPRDPGEMKSAKASDIVEEILSKKSTMRGDVIAAIDRLLTPEQRRESVTGPMFPGVAISLKGNVGPVTELILTGLGSRG